MIKEIIDQWNKNKHKLEEYFRNTKQEKYAYSYLKILIKIFELVIEDDYNIDRITTIDHGNYAGTLIFIIPKNTYEPDYNDYLVTYVYYGSCSGCDTLQGICQDKYGYPTEQQIKDYMTLALHMIQRMKKLYE